MRVTVVCSSIENNINTDFNKQEMMECSEIINLILTQPADKHAWYVTFLAQWKSTVTLKLPMILLCLCFSLLSLSTSSQTSCMNCQSGANSLFMWGHCSVLFCSNVFGSLSFWPTSLSSCATYLLPSILTLIYSSIYIYDSEGVVTVCTIFVLPL